MFHFCQARKFFQRRAPGLRRPFSRTLWNHHAPRKCAANRHGSAFFHVKNGKRRILEQRNKAGQGLNTNNAHDKWYRNWLFDYHLQKMRKLKVITPSGFSAIARAPMNSRRLGFVRQHIVARD